MVEVRHQVSECPGYAISQRWPGQLTSAYGLYMPLCGCLSCLVLLNYCRVQCVARQSAYGAAEGAVCIPQWAVGACRSMSTTLIENTDLQMEILAEIDCGDMVDGQGMLLEIPLKMGEC